MPCSNLLILLSAHGEWLRRILATHRHRGLSSTRATFALSTRYALLRAGFEHKFVRVQCVMHGKSRCDSGKHLFSFRNGYRTFFISDSPSPVTFTKSIWPDCNDAGGPDIIDVMSPQRRVKQSRNTRTSGRWQQIHLYCELIVQGGSRMDGTSALA
jgi:hypothetical protein